MRHARQRNALADIGIQVDDFFRAVHVLEQTLELCLQTPVPFFVIRFIAELDLAISRDRDAVVWIGQIFRCHPEIQRVLRHKLQRESRSNLRSSGGEDLGVGFTHKRDVAHGEIPIFRCKIKIIQAEGLLENRWVLTSGQGKHYRIDVAHVVSSNLA